MSLTRIFLFINAIGWAAFGLYSFFNPQILVDLMGADKMSPDGLFELRSIYGGTSLGAAALFLAGVLKEHMQRPALYFVIAYMGGYAVARAGATVMTGLPSGTLLGFWAIEIVGALIATYLLRRKA